MLYQIYVYYIVLHYYTILYYITSYIYLLLTYNLFKGSNSKVDYYTMLYYIILYLTKRRCKSEDSRGMVLMSPIMSKNSGVVLDFNVCDASQITSYYVWINNI